jgi:hypothetical protein
MLFISRNKWLIIMYPKLPGNFFDTENSQKIIILIGVCLLGQNLIKRIPNF